MYREWRSEPLHFALQIQTQNLLVLAAKHECDAAVQAPAASQPTGSSTRAILVTLICTIPRESFKVIFSLAGCFSYYFPAILILVLNLAWGNNLILPYFSGYFSTSRIRKDGYFLNCRLKQTSPLETGEPLKITFKDSLGMQTWHDVRFSRGSMSTNTKCKGRQARQQTLDSRALVIC